MRFYSQIFGDTPTAPDLPFSPNPAQMRTTSGSCDGCIWPKVIEVDLGETDNSIIAKC